MPLRHAGRPDQTARGRVHPPFLDSCGVVVSDEVQEPVREEEAHFRIEGALARASLPLRRLERNHDVAEDARSAAHGLFVHGEREHVGRTVLASVRAVEHANRRVVDEQHAELRVQEPETSEHP